jgi:hypothetical protein
MSGSRAKHRESLVPVDNEAHEQVDLINEISSDDEPSTIPLNPPGV